MRLTPLQSHIGKIALTGTGGVMLSAASIAATGAIGVAILAGTGLPGCLILEVARVGGAMGGAMLGGTGGLALGLFARPRSPVNVADGVAGYVIGAAAGGAAGYGIMHVVAPAALKLAATAAALAVSVTLTALALGVITMAAMTCGLLMKYCLTPAPQLQPAMASPGMGR